MRILIVGAGDTGRNLAIKLCQMNHDLVVIDPDLSKLERLEAETDLLTVPGSGSSPSLLEQVGISTFDLLIAVSSHDEVNVLACLIAHAAGVRYKVARASDPSLVHTPSIDWKALGVDLMISHKEETAKELARIIKTPGALEIATILDGRVDVVGIKVQPGSRLLDGPLSELNEDALIKQLRFIATVRGERLLVPSGDTCFAAGDEVYMSLLPGDLEDALDWVHPKRPSYSKVIIAGGGDLGMQLAQRLDERSSGATLIERDEDRATHCASQLKHVLVLHGDVADQEMLISAGIGPDSAFFAITGDEELNIVSCVLADKLGAAFTLAQVARPEYVPIIKNLSLLDRVVSPHLSVINAILHFVRGRNVKSAALLHRLPGEILHIKVPKRHKWIGHQIRNLKAPKGTVILAARQGDTVNIPTGHYQVEGGDELVIFCKPESVGRVEKAFRG